MCFVHLAVDVIVLCRCIISRTVDVRGTMLIVNIFNILCHTIVCIVTYIVSDLPFYVPGHDCDIDQYRSMLVPHRGQLGQFWRVSRRMNFYEVVIRVLARVVRYAITVRITLSIELTNQIIYGNIAYWTRMCSAIAKRYVCVVYWMWQLVSTPILCDD